MVLVCDEGKGEEEEEKEDQREKRGKGLSKLLQLCDEADFFSLSKLPSHFWRVSFMATWTWNRGKGDWERRRDGKFGEGKGLVGKGS